LFEAIGYIIYIRERCCVSLVCTFRNTFKSYDVKVDIRKGSLKFREKLTIDVLVSSNVPCFIQMTYILGSDYCELYHVDEY
jgi:hypothetical protein